MFSYVAVVVGLAHRVLRLAVGLSLGASALGLASVLAFAPPRPVNAARLVSPTLRVGDVNATVKGLSHGAGFVLFIKDGHLDRLEGYTYDEPWPTTIDGFQLTYQDNRWKLGFAGSPATEG